MDKKGAFKYIKNNLIQSRVLVYLFLMIIINISIIYYNFKDSNSNCWNAVFFIFGNRYMYILFFIGLFIYLIDFSNDVNYNVIIRLKSKNNWLKLEYINMIFLSVVHSIIFLLVTVISSIAILGYDLNWSENTIAGLDMYTKFFGVISPIQALIIYGVRFFLVIVLLSCLYVMLRVFIKNYNIINGIVLTYLIPSLVFNFKNSIVLSVLDISNDYINYYDGTIKLIQFIFYSNIHIVLLILLEVGIAFIYSKGVEFFCQQAKELSH